MPAYDTDGESMTWSPDAARKLWSFLKETVRQERTSLGKATLSFRGARRPRPGMCAPLSPQSGDAGNKAESAQSNEEHTSPEPETERAGEMRRALDAIDHIAVYCDAWRAPIVHELLYIWQYESRPRAIRLAGDHDGGGTDDGGLSAEGTGPMGKVRILKGARLVLVDGLGQGVLTYA